MKLCFKTSRNMGCWKRPKRQAKPSFARPVKLSSFTWSPDFAGGVAKYGLLKAPKAPPDFAGDLRLLSFACPATKSSVAWWVRQKQSFCIIANEFANPMKSLISFGGDIWILAIYCCKWQNIFYVFCQLYLFLTPLKNTIFEFLNCFKLGICAIILYLIFHMAIVVTRFNQSTKNCLVFGTKLVTKGG